MEFKIGDVVSLKNNRKKIMTVSRFLKVKDICGIAPKIIIKRMLERGYSKRDDVIQCTWFKGSGQMDDYYKPERLRMEPPCEAVPVFEDGDVVYLKSNPEKLMTVSFVIDSGKISKYGSKYLKNQLHTRGYARGEDAVQCVWFYEGSEITLEYFKPQMLAKKS